ncbi:MAG: YjjI family glycine radical enzyme [Firmicutes bacterium]|nr:YjjI family glycine radical enzyme [Bacillota bacterium]
MDQWREFQARVRDAVTSPVLTYEQRVMALAKLAENALPYPEVPPEARQLMEAGVINDLEEGHAPYRPRYILPDYQRFLKQGSGFLEVPPPADLPEAINALTILYHAVPSITGMPVYLGDVDTLLEPYTAGVSDAELAGQIRLFLRLADRLFPDGFVHAVLGPRETRTGHAIFAAERGLRQVVPNWTLKYDPAITPDELLLDAIRTVFEVGKPHFANHPAMVRDLGDKYSVASCYNSLPLGGGSYTLARLNLRRLVEHALEQGHSRETILSTDLPHAARMLLAVMEARIRFIVEEARFFQHSFLASEGLVAPDRFTAMFGLVGLAEAVNLLMAPGNGNRMEYGKSPAPRYGKNPEARELAMAIMGRLREAAATPVPYCEASGGRALLHAQAGVTEDADVTPGVRIPPGDEPELIEHLLWAAPFHAYFPTGISDIFHFDHTVRENPAAVADIIKGAFKSGMREFTFNLADGEFVRVTGYLVRRADLEAVARGRASRYDTSALAKDSVPNQGVLRRAIRRVVAGEMGDPGKGQGEIPMKSPEPGARP